MSLRVVLHTPGTLDFDAYSESTRQLLALLSPLVTQGQSGSKFSRGISLQVVEFVRAIKQGVRAAQCGFTTADDLIALASTPANECSPEETNEYLIGTLKLADEAYSEAFQAFQAFSDVRRRIYRLTDQFNVTLPNNQQMPHNNQVRNAMDDFRNGIPILEKFATQISSLASWWDWIQIETNVSAIKGRRGLVFDDSSLRTPGVLDKRKALRTQFFQYTNMVSELEDRYPELFSLILQPAAVHQKVVRNPKGVHRQDLYRALLSLNQNSRLPRPVQAMCCIIS